MAHFTRGKCAVCVRYPVLTDILTSEPMDERSKLQVAGNYRHLVGCLIGVVKSFAIGPPEEQQSGARFLIVYSANVQGCVARCILGVHVGSVKQQVLQMLYKSITAGLKHKNARGLTRVELR